MSLQEVLTGLSLHDIEESMKGNDELIRFFEDDRRGITNKFNAADKNGGNYTFRFCFVILCCDVGRIIKINYVSSYMKIKYLISKDCFKYYFSTKKQTKR